MNDVDLAPLPGYEEVGEGSAVVMLPGMEGASEFWRFQMDGLGRKYRVISCAYVRRPPRRESSLEEHATDIVRLMNHLDIDGATIVGESWGGMVAQQIAVSHPERVRSLVLCNTMERPRAGDFGFNMFTLACFVHPFAFVMPRDYRKSLLTWVGSHHGFVLDASPGNDDLVDYVLSHGLDPGFGGYLDRILAGRKANFAGDLPGIRAPTLVLRGTEDRIVTHDTMSGIAAAIPDSEFVLIEGGGHCCQHSRPEATNEALLRWLDRVHA